MKAQQLRGSIMANIITVDQLKQLQTEEDVTVVDVRSHLQQPNYGKAAYDKAHIPGAFFLDMEQDLSGETGEHGGNHPLPNVEELAGKLAEMGIDRNQKVVIYDADNTMFAARAWWVLQYIGHEQTMVLEGGLQAWLDLGNEVNAEVPQAETVEFIPTIAAEQIVSMQEVRDRDRNKTVLIDSRAFKRYIGETEPLYKKAGHIPGAQNYFWQDVLTSENMWKDAEVLKQQFVALKAAEEIIVSCGSGISACPNIMALKRAGFNNVKLYPGSFSDWISYEENDVNQGVE